MKAMFAGAAALCLAGAAGAAEPCWMVLGIDVSDSVTKDERELQRAGYATAFSAPELVQAMDGCRVRVVEWAVRTQSMTPWLEPADLPDAYTQVRGDLGNATSPVAIIETAIGLMAGAPGKRILNVTTDGVENTSRKSDVGAARAAAIAADIEVNVLLLDPSSVVNADMWWAKTLATGFVLPAAEPADFERALWAKLRLELADRWSGGEPPS